MTETAFGAEGGRAEAERIHARIREIGALGRQLRPPGYDLETYDPEKARQALTLVREQSGLIQRLLVIGMAGTGGD